VSPSDATLARHLPVATCIGCGARNHSAECADGCSDLPLDLVAADDLAALSARLEALEARVAALLELVHTFVGDAPVGWTALQEQSRAALRLPVPPEPEVEIIEGWGCPRCGRIDVPRQCLGICVRRPGMVADASEYRPLAARSERAATADRALGQLATLVAVVTPRPGREELTTATLRSRARELLERLGG
jgi:hypothetical protein